MKVHVAYDELNNTSSKLKSIDSDFDTLIANLESTKDEISAAGSKHDKCYEKAINTIDRIIINYKKHQAALQFIQQQCEAASIAFKKAEDGSIDMTNQIAIDYVTQIGTNILGIDESEFKNLKLEEYTEEELKTAIEEATNADSSKTWNTVFDYEDDDILTDAGASISKNAKSIIEPGEKKDKKKKGQEDGSYNDGTSNGDTSNGGPSNDGPSNGGGGTEVSPIAPITPVNPKDSDKSGDDAEPKDSDKSGNDTEPKDSDKSGNDTEPKDSDKSGDDTDPKDSDKSGNDTEPKDSEQPVTPEQPAQQPYVEDPYEEQYTHTGGGYSSEDGYYTYDQEENGITDNLSGLEVEEEDKDLVEDILDDSSEGINIASEGKKYTKIPSSTTPITTTTTSKSKGNSIIPIAAGISAAAAAGIGAKAYMDRKNNNENGEEYDDEIESDEWDENSDNIEVDYNDSSNKEEYLEEDDNYEYQALEDEKYGARSNEELADLQ